MSDRIDVVMVERELVKTRSQARMLIKQGDVLLNGKKILKPGKIITDLDEVTIKERGLYVSRGAYKLLHAIEKFNLNFVDKVIADCGASTGGFSQVSILSGASKVYSIDVGHDQLDQILIDNPKVINLEGVNLKNDYKLPELVDFCVADLSFISITMVYPTMKSLLKPGGKSMVLIKPQFEAGSKDRLGKGGLVSDSDRADILNEVLTWFKDNGHEVIDYCESPIKGKTGNIEYLALIG